MAHNFCICCCRTVFLLFVRLLPSSLLIIHVESFPLQSKLLPSRMPIATAVDTMNAMATTTARASIQLMTRRKSPRLTEAFSQVTRMSQLSNRMDISSSMQDDFAGTAAVPVTPSPIKKSRTKKTKKDKSSKDMLKSDKVQSPTYNSRKRKSASMASINSNHDKDTKPSSIFLTKNMVANINPSQPFIDLHVPPQELRPSATLTTGQCFHWSVLYDDDNDDDDGSDSIEKVSAWGTHNATEFIGILRLDTNAQNADKVDQSRKEAVVVVIRETPTTTLYRPLTPILFHTNDNNNNNTTNNLLLHQQLRKYFQLDIPLEPLYKEWSQSCSRLKAIAKCIPGVRIIRQDPWECLVSFICSSNNNIPRITQILSRLRKEYGTILLTIDSDENEQQHRLYSFPSLNELYDKATEQELRTKCGMGYRAKYLIETMKILKVKGGETYLDEVLCNIQDPIVLQTKLCEFHGIGRKVADCIALFSLQQDNAIPVDTHVWNIALRDYDDDEDYSGDDDNENGTKPSTSLSTIKSLTPTNYQRVGDVFRKRFPNRSGWAHSLLFVAELPSFRQVLPQDIVKEMDTFRAAEQVKKKQKKEDQKGK